MAAAQKTQARVREKREKGAAVVGVTMEPLKAARGGGQVRSVDVAGGRSCFMASEELRPRFGKALASSTTSALALLLGDLQSGHTSLSPHSFFFSFTS